MNKKYNVEIAPNGQEVIWYQENDVRYSFGTDPANSDYQAYLAWLENPEAEQSTPSVIDEA